MAGNRDDENARVLYVKDVNHFVFSLLINCGTSRQNNNNKSVQNREKRSESEARLNCITSLLCCAIAEQPWNGKGSEKSKVREKCERKIFSGNFILITFISRLQSVAIGQQ